MRPVYINRRKKQKHRKILRTFLTIILCVAAIGLGVFTGDTLYDLDVKIIQDIDTSNFKTTLNKSLPIINAIYNSGNISVSFLGEVKDIISYIFDFDLNYPVTILSSQSSYFNDYYNKILIAQEEDNHIPGDHGNISENQQIEEFDAEEEKIAEGGSGIEYNQDREDSEGGFIEEIDVAWIHEELEDRDLSNTEMGCSGEIIIRNETKYKIDISAMLKEPLKIKFDKKGPKILVYHSHTSEAYLKNIEDLKKSNISNTSSDPRNNVVRVGNELAQSLEKIYGMEVIHNATVHDYVYNRSYGSSLNTMTQILKSYPSIKITLDIHRDGLPAEQGKLRVVKEKDGRNLAQVMFVMGTDANGLKHPEWRENLKMAIKLQEKLNEICPGLARPILISKNRYNQHMTTGSLTIEVGGDGNTLNEALESTKYVARAISEVMN